MDSTDTMRHLAAIGSGTPLTVFVWVLTAGNGVTQTWLESMTGYSDKTIAPALEKLSSLQYIVRSGRGWIVAPARQGVLGEVLEALAAPRLDVDTPSPAEQAGQGGVGNSDSEGAAVLIIKDSSNTEDSLKQEEQQTNAGRNFRLPRNDRHLSQVAAALLRKGVPRPNVDDPFPPDLRVAVEHLVGLGLSCKRAEIAVSGSPWPAPKILEQIDIWAAYQKSIYGANLDAGKFPYLVGARVSAGDECPQDTRGASTGGKYDGYLKYTSGQEE